MLDCEYINRFSALTLLNIDKYYGNMEEYLTEALKYMNEMTDTELNKHAKQFQRSIENNYNVFGNNAFRKPRKSPEARRTRLNIALFDVFSVCLSHYSETEVNQQKDNIRKAFDTAINECQFKSSINSNFAKASQKHNIEFRFDLVKRILNEIMI